MLSAAAAIHATVAAAETTIHTATAIIAIQTAAVMNIQLVAAVAVAAAVGVGVAQAALATIANALILTAIVMRMTA